MTFTLIANAVLGAAVLFSLIAGICAINGTPVTAGLRELAQRMSTARPELAKPERAPVGIKLGS